MNKRIVVVLGCLLFAGGLFGKSLALSGVEERVRMYRPLKPLLRGQSLKVRKSIYKRATRLFRKELRSVGMRFDRSVRREWERQVRPLFYKADSVETGDGARFARKFLNEYHALFGDLADKLESKGRDLESTVRVLNRFIRRNRRRLAAFREMVKKFKISRDKNVTRYVMKNLGPLMKLSRRLKKCIKPYKDDPRVKAASKMFK